MKRARALFSCAFVVALGVVAVPATAGAATPVDATGSIQCTISGKISFSPAIHSFGFANKVKVSAKLTGCSAAHQGALVGGTVSGTATPEPSFLNAGNVCNDLVGPLQYGSDLKIKWKTKSPTPRLAVTNAPDTLGSPNVDATTHVVSEDDEGVSIVPGSFGLDFVKLQIVYDTDATALNNNCNTRKGVHTETFTGINGASTLQTTPLDHPPCSDENVDQVKGTDAFNGDCSVPFMTITKAASLLQPGGNMVIEPGTYDAAHGEVFPISLGEDFLFSDVRAFPSLLSSQGTNPDTQIDGELDFNNAMGKDNQGLLDALDLHGQVTGDVDLGTSTITGGGADGNCLDMPSGFVSDSVVSGCANAGLFTNGDVGASGNLFTANAINVQLGAAATADLNANSGGSPRANTFTCATTADIVSAAPSIDGGGNNWDHVPPSVQVGGSPSGGVDVFTADAGDAGDTSGALLAASPCA
jgi:hypothetical protein